MEDTKRIYNANTTNLAYIGDAIYEVYVREMLMKREPRANTNLLQKHSKAYVSARAQAAAIKAVMDELLEEEQKLIKRARNKKSASKPKNASPIDYKWATALEALVGYLYLTGQKTRLDEVVKKMIAASDRENPR